MITNLLATVEGVYMFFIDMTRYVFFFVYYFIIALVVICLIRMVKYLAASGKEQKLIRMELSKVAEEVHLMRQRLEGSAEKKEPEGEEQE